MSSPKVRQVMPMVVVEDGAQVRGEFKPAHQCGRDHDAFNFTFSDGWDAYILQLGYETTVRLHGLTGALLREKDRADAALAQAEVGS